MQLTRRNLLKAGLLGGTAVALPVSRAVGSLSEVFLDDIVASPPVPTFAVPLRIPPVLQPVRTTETTDFYQIVQREASLQIIPGLGPTRIWGYNGITPRPTIHQTRGRNVVVRQVNRLQVPTTTHLHGGDIPPEADGHPLDLVHPGEFFDYFYPGLHPAANLWYHDHAIHETGRNVYMGLAAHYLITDETEQRLPLPKGRFDVPLVVQDKFFLRDGSIGYPRHDEERPLRQGVFGDVILVNGTPKPCFRVARRKYRFRLLHGSNARPYRFRLSSGEPFIAVGTEGGLLPAPIDEVRVDGVDPAAAVFDELPDLDGPEPRPRVDAVGLEQLAVDDPGAVAALETPASGPNRQLRAHVLGYWAMSAGIRLGSVTSSTMLKRITLRTCCRITLLPTRYLEKSMTTGIRSEGVITNSRMLRRLERVAGYVAEHVRVPHPRPQRAAAAAVGARAQGQRVRGRTRRVRVVMRWNHFTGRYVMHCHNVEHEDHDMMTQFEVV